MSIFGLQFKGVEYCVNESMVLGVILEGHQGLDAASHDASPVKKQAENNGTHSYVSF